MQFSGLDQTKFRTSALLAETMRLRKASTTLDRLSAGPLYPRTFSTRSPRNEVSHCLQKLFRLVHKRHVSATGQNDELRPGNLVVHLTRHLWIALIVIADDDQGRDLD